MSKLLSAFFAIAGILALYNGKPFVEVLGWLLLSSVERVVAEIEEIKNEISSSNRR